MALANGSSLKILNDGNNQFTAKFFSRVAKENEGKSVVMSAFSVLQPLAQLALASVGESHDELLKAIGLPNDDVTKEVFPIVNSDLRAIKGVQLKMANKIYVTLNAELKEDFSALSKTVFGSEFKNINFAKNTEAAAEINAWVEDQTNRRIKDLLDSSSLGGDTRAVLVNAIYFKGTWLKKFDKDLTIDRDFYVTKDKTIMVPIMNKQSVFKYAESQELNAQLLELPYEGEEASMLIMLPNEIVGYRTVYGRSPSATEIDGLAALKEKLKDPAALDKAVENMHQLEVNVYLPKFKIETTIDLRKVLQKMGIQCLFDPARASLDNLLKNEAGLHISKAIQKAFIEVNEEGAEAAAANAFLAFTTSVRLIPEFRADHPFLYFLIARNNKLFSGVFANKSL